MGIDFGRRLIALLCQRMHYLATSSAKRSFLHVKIEYDDAGMSRLSLGIDPELDREVKKTYFVPH